MVGVVWREDEVIWLVFRRRVWRDGRVRRGAREVRVVMWFPDKSIEWMVSGRLLVVDRDSQAWPINELDCLSAWFYAGPSWCHAQTWLHG